MYEFVLFLHLLSLAAAFFASGMLHLAQFKMSRAKTVGEVATWGAVLKSVAPFMIVPALGLFGSGAYLVVDKWAWSHPWVYCSIAGLVLVQGLGALAGKRGERVGAAIGEAMSQGGPAQSLTERLRACVRDPWTHGASNAISGTVLAVMYIMTQKTGLAASLALLALGVLAGAALAAPLWLERRQVSALEHAPVTKPEPAVEG